MSKLDEVIKLAVANLGEEELEQLRHTVLTRADTQAEADALFGVAPQVREKDRQQTDKLFVQGKVARHSNTSTMAPDVLNVPGPKQPDIAGALIAAKAEMPKTAAKQESRPKRWMKNGALIGGAAGAAIGGGGMGVLSPRLIPAGMLLGGAEGAIKGGLIGGGAGLIADAVSKKKKASVATPAIDAFVEKTAGVYLRYPELQKVAASPTGATPKVVSKPKTTETSGPNPVQNSLSGGAA